MAKKSKNTTTTKFEVRAVVHGSLSMKHSSEDTKEKAIKIAKRECVRDNSTYFVKRVDTKVVHISRPSKPENRTHRVGQEIESKEVHIVTDLKK